jgi:hypothetical protein
LRNSSISPYFLFLLGISLVSSITTFFLSLFDDSCRVGGRRGRKIMHFLVPLPVALQVLAHRDRLTGIISPVSLYLQGKSCEKVPAGAGQLAPPPPRLYETGLFGLGGAACGSATLHSPLLG